jgi:hypothetical protein
MFGPAAVKIVITYSGGDAEKAESHPSNSLDEK